MGLPVDPVKPMIPPESPVAGAVQAVLDAGYENWRSGLWFSYQSCDVLPSIHVGGSAGYRLNLGSEYYLFPEHADIAHDDLAAYLGPTRGPFLLRLGSAMGFVWYQVYSDYESVAFLRSHLNMKDGEDVYPLYVKRPSPEYVAFPELEQNLQKLNVDELEVLVAGPPSVKTYADAYLVLRGKQGKPVSKDVYEACGVLCSQFRSIRIRRYGEIIQKATQHLATDPEAALPWRWRTIAPKSNSERSSCHTCPKRHLTL